MLTDTQIVLADDFEPWRRTVRSILGTLPDLHIIAEAGDGAEAVWKAATLLPDIVLLDIGMPLLNGIEAAKRIKQACPEAKIIFLTQQNDVDMRNAALATGAEAYLLGSRAACELLPTIEMTLLNGSEGCSISRSSHSPHRHSSPEDLEVRHPVTRTP